MITMQETQRGTQPITTDEAAQILATILNAGLGRISDEGRPRRPWLYIDVATEDEARQLYKAFELGFIKPRWEGHGWRYGAWGNDALELCEYLLDAGLDWKHSGLAERLLEKYGDEGRSWRSEVERLRVERRRTQEWTGEEAMTDSTP